MLTKLSTSFAAAVLVGASSLALAAGPDKADQVILASCPAEAPLTPPGRLAAIKSRLTAMQQGIEDVRPALQAFWTSLHVKQQTELASVMAPKVASAAATTASAK